MVLRDKEDGQFHFRHIGFEVAIDIQVSYPIVFRYMGLKLRRVYGSKLRLEAQIWRSLAMASICSHTGGPEHPRKSV